MSRADLPARGAPPNPRRFRWVLHLAVLLLAVAAVVIAVRGRTAGDGAPSADGGGPPQSSIAAVETPQPTSPPSPTPAPTASPSPTPEPSPTPPPTPTPEPSPTPEPESSPTPEPAAEPTPVPAPPRIPQPTLAPVRPPAPTPRPVAVVTARAIDTASLRSAPGADSLITGYLPPGSVVTVVGCSGGCSWLLVASAGGTAWSARHFWAVSGDLSTIGVR